MLKRKNLFSNRPFPEKLRAAEPAARALVMIGASAAIDASDGLLPTVDGIVSQDIAKRWDDSHVVTLEEYSEACHAAYALGVAVGQLLQPGLFAEPGKGGKR